MKSLRTENKALTEKISVDNGSEPISNALDKWTYDNNVILDFSRSGKPTDDTYIGSFEGSFWDEYLNTNWFLSLQDARGEDKSLEDKIQYHGSLNRLTPRSNLK